MRKLLAFIAASFLAAPAFAQSPDSGFYVGGHLGQAEGRDACNDFSGVPGVSCDDKDTAWRILGGYQFNRNLSIEGAYTDLGELSATGPGGSVSAEASALELVGVGSFPLTNRFSLYGKAGVYRGEVEGRLDTALVTGSDKDENTDFTYGAGVKFDMTQNVALRAEWQRYNDMGGDDTTETDVDVLSVGAIFKF
jgi:OOP family OmpA-OmpF porin